MKRLQLLAIIVCLSAANTGQAARPRIHFFRATPHVVRAVPSYDETYRYLNWRYPKYVGGFHASYFRDLGVPTGDVGLRTNGLYVTPW